MKTILLALCGLSPQVATETLYALHQQGRLPDAVRIITTRGGKEKCLAELFGSDDGHYYRFLEDYGLDPNRIDFQRRHLVTVTDEFGRELDDITCEEDNAAFLSVCMDEAFRATRDDKCRVFFSIAGGRKTMSACLGLAAQCYARPQDRIFHVLVSPEFESCGEFFYPPPEKRLMELRDERGQPCYKEGRLAQVSLIHLPFPSIRERLGRGMLRRPESPSALLLSLVQEEKPFLCVNLREKKLIWKGVELDMRATHLALYAFFAARKKESACRRRTCRGCADCFVPMSDADLDLHQQDIAGFYRKISAVSKDDRRVTQGGILALDAQNFRSYKSRIKEQLESRFGPYEAPKLEINSTGDRPSTRYGIALDRELIEIVW